LYGCSKGLNLECCLFLEENKKDKLFWASFQALIPEFQLKGIIFKCIKLKTHMLIVVISPLSI
jgi:hypothetical protein